MFITYLQREFLVRIPDGPSVIVAKQNTKVHARKAVMLLAQDSIKLHNQNVHDFGRGNDHHTR